MRCEGEFDRAYPIKGECRREHEWSEDVKPPSSWADEFTTRCMLCKESHECDQYGEVTDKRERWCFKGIHMTAARRVIGSSSSALLRARADEAVQHALDRHAWCDGRGARGCGR